MRMVNRSHSTRVHAALTQVDIKVIWSMVCNSNVFDMVIMTYMCR